MAIYPIADDLIASDSVVDDSKRCYIIGGPNNQLRKTYEMPRDAITLCLKDKPWEMPEDDADETLEILEDPKRGIEFLNSMNDFTVSLMPYAGVR